MDIVKQHWSILRELGTELESRVRSFMVIVDDGDGVMVATDDGEAYWVGTMRFGLRYSRTANKPIPLNVPGLVVQMAQGFCHILLLTESGQLYTMGQNDRGQMGLGTIDGKTRFSPQLIPLPSQKFVSIRCGTLHNLALTDDGKVWRWGSDEHDTLYDKVGSARSFFSPRQIPELDKHRIVAVECGGGHSLALTDQGVVYGWGSNKRGELGDGSGLSTNIPIRIPTPSLVKSMAAGYLHTLLLTRTGQVYACGKNDYCQLGLPDTIVSSLGLVHVEGLPPILQIASHHDTNLSIAMSHNGRCFVWGELRGRSSISIPLKLHPDYSTVESPLAFYSSRRSTTRSIQITETIPNRLSTKMSRMFDNPETSDVQFVVVEQQRTIHAHRNILSNSSDYFGRMFSERWRTPVDPEDPIVKVTIPDHSYPAFYAFLRFLYTDCLEEEEVKPDLLPELFELANQYLDSNLQQLCLTRMRTTLTTVTCSLYYPIVFRYSFIPELDSFRQELIQFVSIRMSVIATTAAYQSMESNVRDNLTNAVGNLLGT